MTLIIPKKKTKFWTVTLVELNALSLEVVDFQRNVLERTVPFKLKFIIHSSFISVNLFFLCMLYFMLAWMFI